MPNGNTMFDNSKQFIIVSDEEHMKYAEFLKGYLPPKVLNCKCVIYKVKEYVDNRAKITSTNKILFLGENNDIKKEYINNKFDSFGIYIGWHGNNALIATDGEPISKENYNVMMEDAKRHEISIAPLSEADIIELDNLHKNGLWAYIGSGPVLGKIRAFVEEKTNANACVSTIVLVNTILGMSIFLGGGLLGGYSIYASVKSLKRILSILDDHKHQYAVKKFVDDFLKEFLEG